MNDLTDDELLAIISSGGKIGAQDAKIKQSQEMAKLIRDFTPESRMWGNGRVMAAQSPLTTIAQGVGAYASKKNMDEQGVLAGDKSAMIEGQNAAIMAALLRKRKKVDPSMGGDPSMQVGNEPLGDM
jgi:hypothetical protein